MRHVRRYIETSLIALLFSIPAGVAHAAIPALSSHPGAAYKVYLDFGGFNFTGLWGEAGGKPGMTAAYGNTAFIEDTWARVSEKYSAFNIDVTTIDPAVAAGQAGSDLQRQHYYDNTADVMHTVIGHGNWDPGVGGVSYVGVTSQVVPSINGSHTNWIFTNNLADSSRNTGEAVSHENGHGFGLVHQSDYRIGGGSINEYSSNGGATGFGSVAPVMGNSYGSQRGTWRVGTMDTGFIQNDVASILQFNPGLSLINDGIGHSFAAATALPLTGTSVDSALAKGVITPASSTAPNPLGVDNYTKDYFKFHVGVTGGVTLSLIDGGDWLRPGEAAAGATLRASLNIYKVGDLDTPFATATESTDTLSDTFSGTLAAGDYYSEITSYGGMTSTFDPTAQYYTMGSFLLRGTGFSAIVVPEAGTLALFGASLVVMIPIFRRKSRSKGNTGSVMPGGAITVKSATVLIRYRTIACQSRQTNDARLTVL